MKRAGLVLASLVLWGSAAIAQPATQQRRQAAAQADPAVRQDRALQLIADVYVTQFQSTVGLNEEQYLRVGMPVRQFVLSRFRVANQRAALNQRRAELLALSDPSQAEVQKLSDDIAQFERRASNTENDFITRIRSELSPRQVLLVLEFNKSFFQEKLPQLLERARAEAASRGQTARPNRPNANRGKNPAPPVESFRSR